MKLNEFMFNTFTRTRDITMGLWPHRLVTGFLTLDQILAGTLVEFCDVIIIFESWVFFSLTF